MGVKVTIENFRSLSKTVIELGSLTLLIGPPSSGKSTILDALALAGFFKRFHGNDYGKLPRTCKHRRYDLKSWRCKGTRPEPFPASVRSLSCLFSLYPFGDQSKTPRISVDDEGTIEVVREEREHIVRYNKERIYKCRLSKEKNREYVEHRFQGSGGVFESRLYSFGRYTALDVLSVKSFFLPRFGKYRYPENVLREDAKNALNIVYSLRDVIPTLNEYLKDLLGGNIEIKVGNKGNVMIFDSDYQVSDFNATSDGLIRLLYYLFAIKSSKVYSSINNLPFVLLLEEPEAHIFPYFIDLIVDEVVEAITDNPHLKIVIATHNPILVSALSGKIEDLRVYYVYRRDKMFTDVKEVDFKKLGEELLSIEDLMLLNTNELFERGILR